jgi:hypothetical protein
MATYLENLTTARDNVAARLVEITADKKPSYSIDGQSVSWSEYFDTLTKQLDQLNKLINAQNPYFIVSQFA